MNERKPLPYPAPLPPCDICGELVAPFGFELPGGHRVRKPGQRALKSCAAPACLTAARARQQAAANPASVSRRRVPSPTPDQKTLFD
jgi:hypothetical protein